MTNAPDDNVRSVTTRAARSPAVPLPAAAARRTDRDRPPTGRDGSTSSLAFSQVLAASSEVLSALAPPNDPAV